MVKLIPITVSRNTQKSWQYSKSWRKSPSSKVISSISRVTSIPERRMCSKRILSMKASRLYADLKVASSPEVKSSVLLLPEPSLDSPRCCFWMRPHLHSMRTVKRKFKMLSTKPERVAL